MSSSNRTPSHEAQLLAPTRALLAQLTGSLPDGQREEGYYRILESTACSFGGLDYSWYRGHETKDDPKLPLEDGRAALRVLAKIAETPIPVPLALSSLAIPELDSSARRQTGAYHTDFRLADHAAGKVDWDWRRGTPVIIDPAAGTGILLVACVLRLAGKNQGRVNKLLGEGIIGTDLTERSLRGCRLALSSLTSHEQTAKDLRDHLICADSLIAGPDVLLRQCGPADVIIGNPPWGKLKVSRHEFLVKQGVERHYGDSYNDPVESVAFANERASQASNNERLKNDYSHQGSGELDTYKLFLELALRLTKKDGGQVVQILPAGLLHGSGTQALRSHILNQSARLNVDLFFNHARFFAVDTRTKFITLSCRTNSLRARSVVLRHFDGTPTGVAETGAAKMSCHQLKAVRPDLSVPEVRSPREWSLFSRLCELHPKISELPAHLAPHLMREVDMTRERSFFLNRGEHNALPLLEGRMVHQYRHAVKSYTSGTGRRANWEVQPPTCNELNPQFFIDPASLPERVQRRAAHIRIGFCDIAGQTNERTMLAAEIPKGVVCGNKVPTMLFPGAGQEDERVRLYWLGVLNSFIFDWMLRRICTTTVNYHLLRSLPFPAGGLNSADGQRLARVASKLSDTPTRERHHVTANIWEAGELRAEADCLVARLYGVSFSEMALVLDDFPLLDRGQETLHDERVSLVTRACLLSRFGRFDQVDSKSRILMDAEEQLESYREGGAVPYVPSYLR